MKEYSPDIIGRAKKIKILLLDIDGVLTDGRIIRSNKGDELKNFDVNDGLGILLVKRSGIKCIILTAKASRIVSRRAKDLKIDKVYQGFHYKLEALEDILVKFKVSADEICFVGDDVIDVPVLKRVGLAVCPPNAMSDVKPLAHLITEKKGGRGAVREICDLILKAQGTWSKVTARYFND